mmetsp:Transcript_876/g.1326  ORF Transcript_876/g.1326 Transcript_876/m.1326 type:complete len:85 (+) Transcript_876:1578-1832(+)
MSVGAAEMMRQSRNSQHISIKQNVVGPRRASGPIGVPFDMSVAKMAKSKNDSMFTNSMIHGDHTGYTIGNGIQNELFKKRPVMK